MRGAFDAILENEEKNETWIAVELPMKVAAILRPLRQILSDSFRYILKLRGSSCDNGLCSI